MRGDEFGQIVEYVTEAGVFNVTPELFDLSAAPTLEAVKADYAKVAALGRAKTLDVNAIKSGVVRYVAAVLIVLLALGALTTVRSEREQFAVYAVDLPYHTHITSTLTEQAVAMLSSCSEPLNWTQARGWDLPAGYSRFRMLIAIPDLSIYAVIQEHYWATGGSTARRPYAMRLNGTGWYGASYNAAPTPHGAAGSCWIDGGALNAFEAELRRDANWPG